MAGVLMLVGSGCQESRGTEGWRGDSPWKGGWHKRRHHTALKVLLVHLDVGYKWISYGCISRVTDSKGYMYLLLKNTSSESYSTCNELGILSGIPRIWGRGVLRHSRAKRARKIFSHTPKTLTTPLIKRILEGSWLTKKAVLGQIATRNCCFGSEF